MKWSRGIMWRKSNTEQISPLIFSINFFRLPNHHIFGMENTEKPPGVSIESLFGNGNQIGRLRTIMCIVNGIICGIFGFTGLQGLIFYLLSSTLVDASIISKMNFDTKKYLNTSIFQFLMDGISQSVMSFILFWTLSFAVVYIYWNSNVILAILQEIL